MFGFLKKLFGKKEETVEALGKIVIRRVPRKPTVDQPSSLTFNSSQPIQFLLNDPSTSDLMFQVSVPTENPPLDFRVSGYMGGGYPFGTIQGQAALVYVGLLNTMKYMISMCKQRNVTRWAAANPLVVFPRAGQDLNAYYDRSALKFFFFPDPVSKKTVFTCESTDVVFHEFGHAFLDAIRPDFWSTQSLEVWAFHEAFGDMTAILGIMQYDLVLDRAIAETGGDLGKSNIISRLAEEMGATIYRLVPPGSGRLANALREAANNFVYVEPEKLPADSPDDQLSNECHNFSRVWTGCWYEIMVRMYEQNVAQGMERKAALVKARDRAAEYMLHGVVHGANHVRTFDGVARQMLHCDRGCYGEEYQKVMMDVFTRRNMLREGVMMQGSWDWDSWVQSLSEPVAVQELGDTKLAQTASTRTIKLVDHLGLSALADNPLFNVEIEVPFQNTYEFQNGVMVQAAEVNEEEVIDSAFACLNYLHHNNLVGKHKNALFEVKNGKLLRKNIICRCPMNNACDKNAPEYGKIYKPQNNAGCCCKGKPLSCKCDPPPAPTPPKAVCHSSVTTGGYRTYVVGGNISRKVC